MSLSTRAGNYIWFQTESGQSLKRIVPRWKGTYPKDSFTASEAEEFLAEVSARVKAGERADNAVVDVVNGTSAKPAKKAKKSGVFSKKKG